MGISDTQEAVGTLMCGVELDISGTLLSPSIYSIPLGVYFKNQSYFILFHCDLQLHPCPVLTLQRPITCMTT